MSNTKRNQKKLELQTKVRDIIYDYVFETFGRSEADDPSWYIPTLAEEIADKLLDGNYKPKHPYHNTEDDSELEDNEE